MQAVKYLQMKAFKLLAQPVNWAYAGIQFVVIGSVLWVKKKRSRVGCGPLGFWPQD